MSSHRILVPIDFTPSSDEALKTVPTLAHGCGTSPWIVHLNKPQVSVKHWEYLNGYPSESMNELQRILDGGAAPVESAPYEQRLLEGPAANAMLDLAEAEHVDRIVLGNHDRRGMSLS